MYVNTRNRYVKYRAGTLIAVPVPTRNVRDNTRTRSKAFTLRSLCVHHYAKSMQILRKKIGLPLSKISGFWVTKCVF